MGNDEKHDKAIYIRVTAADMARLEALADQIEITTKAGIARAALRLGLDAIEQDPAVLLGMSHAKLGGKRHRAGRKGRK